MSAVTREHTARHHYGKHQVYIGVKAEENEYLNLNENLKRFTALKDLQVYCSDGSGQNCKIVQWKIG